MNFSDPCPLVFDPLAHISRHLPTSPDRMSQRSTPTRRTGKATPRRPSVASLVGATAKPPAMARAFARDKNQRTTSPVNPPTAAVRAADDAALDRGFPQATGGVAPMRVNPHRKRSTVISPRATVVEGPTPVQVSKRPRVLNTEEERLTGRAEVEGAVITVTNPTQEEIPAGASLVTDLGSSSYNPGEEEAFYMSDATALGTYCMCENATDPSSVYGELVQCERGDLCAGSFYYQL